MVRFLQCGGHGLCAREPAAEHLHHCRLPAGGRGSDLRSGSPPDSGPRCRPAPRLRVRSGALRRRGPFTGERKELGEPVALDAAGELASGYCLLNDWSAPDIQGWESALGPFLATSASTSISPWVVTAEAMAPFHTAAFKRPPGDP